MLRCYIFIYAMFVLPTKETRRDLFKEFGLILIMQNKIIRQTFSHRILKNFFHTTITFSM